jgi:putative flippase GtrA
MASVAMSNEAGAQPQTWWKKLTGWWATRSLAIGAGATVVDVTIGTLLVSVAHLPTRASAMLALGVGTTLNFLAHRYFAFREHNPKLASPAMRWLLMTVVQTIVHGQLVVMLRDWWGVPFVPAKMAADLVVFSAAQLLLVRYVVFPKKSPEATEVAATTSPSTSPSESAPARADGPALP